ncbi:ATP-NAD kinase [Alteromonadaceae bacterium M269]|nr:ATP-NAD kinase [Alteromonadaceae bacterium M269]
MQRKFRLGLVINPYAGIGGALALKGSDGAEIREKALAEGAVKQAESKTRLALEIMLPLQEECHIYTATGEMGEALLVSLGFNTTVVYSAAQEQTEAEDTQACVQALIEQQVDLILFAGGDGTARNICQQVEDASQANDQKNTVPIPVLGIPAGCKIHSGVFAVTPKAAGRITSMLAKGELVNIDDADVMDIDESLFREGQVKAKRYGQMRVPSEVQYIQAVKQGGKESEEGVLQEIADYLIDEMDDEIYVMGSGSTVDFVMQQLGLDNTLLGVDLVYNEELEASDVTGQQLLSYLQEHSDKPCKLVITLIGGQGHIFGRGNQQLTPDVIRHIGIQNIIIIASKTKLQNLNGRPLIADTGDPVLDSDLVGFLPVITGYRNEVLYPVASPGA